MKPGVYVLFINLHLGASGSPLPLTAISFRNDGSKWHVRLFYRNIHFEADRPFSCRQQKQTARNIHNIIGKTQIVENNA
jgi:hypothetical protein